MMLRINPLPLSGNLFLLDICCFHVLALLTFVLQGAIQGPQEFAEGLALGVKSLLGHAVGTCFQ